MRMSERSQAAYEEHQEKRKSDQAEAAYEKLWKEVETRYKKPLKRSKPYSAKEIASIQDPEILYSIVDGEDGEFIQNHLSADQLRAVLSYRDEMLTKIKNDVVKEVQKEMHELTPRVTKLLKIFTIHCGLQLRLRDYCDDKYAMLTIWRPTEEDCAAIFENGLYDFYNLTATGIRNSILQLANTKKTTFLPNASPQPTNEFRRVVTPLSAVESSNFTPAYGELDTAGVVVLIKLPEHARGVTVVYLSDLDGHFLSITFWTTLSVFGCEDLMTEGSLIACSNLQWRSVSGQRKIPSAFASEFTSFSTCPKQPHLRTYVDEIKSSLAQKDFGESIAQAKTHIIQASKFRDSSGGVGSPAYRSPAPATPATPGPSKTPVGASSSTPNHQKLKILSRYEDAPPLTPMQLTVATRQVFQHFKSPVVTPKAK